jgi:hypothetical protein
MFFVFSTPPRAGHQLGTWVNDNMVEVPHLINDAAAMLAVRTPAGTSALTAAAAQSSRACACAPLLLLLRRVAVEPQPCDDAQQAHMSEVEELCTGARSEQLFVDNQLDDARDEWVQAVLCRRQPALFCRASSASTHRWRACRTSSTRPSWAWRLRGGRRSHYPPAVRGGLPVAAATA